MFKIIKEQTTLDKIKELLIRLNNKVDRLEWKVAELDSHITSGLDLKTETKLVKVIINFIS